MSLLTSYVTPLSVPASQGIRSWTTFWAQPHSLVHKSSAERPTFQSGLGPNIVRKDMMWRVRSTENSAEGAARLWKTVRMRPMNQSSWWVSQLTNGNFLKNCGPQFCVPLKQHQLHPEWSLVLVIIHVPTRWTLEQVSDTQIKSLVLLNNSPAHYGYPDQVFWTWSVSFAVGYTPLLGVSLIQFHAKQIL